jgi:drug/metabolite transporter (DMT)-like permease
MKRPGLTAFDFALYGGVVFVWGFSWFALRQQVGVVAPEVSVIWRFLLSAPVMIAIALWRGETLRLPARDHLQIVALGVTMFGTNFALFYYGGKFIPSGLLSVIFALASVFNVALSVLVLRTRADWHVVAGGLLGALGVAAMFYPQIAGTQMSSGAWLGLVLCVCGTLSFCIGNMIAAKLQRRGIPVFTASGLGMLYGSAALAAVAVLRGATFTIEPTFAYLASLLYLAIGASVVAFGCYLTLLGRIGADRAAYSSVMFPVVALAVSTLFEGYHWTWPAALGLLAVLGGNLLVLRPARQAA